MNPDTSEREPLDGLPPGLLEPSLTAERSLMPLYSVRAMFLTGFFGGPFAAALFAGYNSWRSGRLNRDLWLYALAAMVASAALYVSTQSALGQTGPEWLTTRNVRHGAKLLGLIVVGVAYLRLGPLFRAADVTGQEAPNGFKLGLALTAVGWAHIAVITLSAGAGR